jgi:hypothetical protein
VSQAQLERVMITPGFYPERDHQIEDRDRPERVRPGQLYPACLLNKAGNCAQQACHTQRNNEREENSIKLED